MSHPERKRYSRRDFLKTATAGAGLIGLGALGRPTRLAAAPVKKIPVGVQLYSVREQAAKDLPAVLEAIGKMGYKGVEFAGYYGWEGKPKELQEAPRRERPAVLRHAHRARDRHRRQAQGHGRAARDARELLPHRPEPPGRGRPGLARHGQEVQRHRGQGQGAGHARRLSRPRRGLPEVRAARPPGRSSSTTPRRTSSCSSTPATACRAAATPWPS